MVGLLKGESEGVEGGVEQRLGVVRNASIAGSQQNILIIPIVSVNWQLLKLGFHFLTLIEDRDLIVLDDYI